MGRRSVWSKPELIALAEEFTPAADEVYRLQVGHDAECVAFRRAVRGSDEPVRGSMQGIYVFTPTGTLLARRNSNHAGQVAEILASALEKWRALPAEERTAAGSPIAGSHRWEDCCPEDGLILTRTARDLAASGGPEATRIEPFNRDQIWFDRDEAAAWVPTGSDVGDRHVVPQPLVQRLAQFHLVDNVRGQTLPFAPSEVSGHIETEVLDVVDGRVRIAIRGHTKAIAEGPWLLGDNYWKPKREWPRSIEVTLVGRATWDPRAGAFSRFETVALGTRVGRTTFNGRARSPNDTPQPIGFAITLAPRTLRIAPTFINVYNADWVVHPE